MYLHAGNNKIIRTRNVIGIFDMDNATQGADTREFLRRAEKEGKVELSKAEIPKSFVLYTRTNQKTKQKKEKKKIQDTAVCISQLSTLSLAGRTEKRFD